MSKNDTPKSFRFSPEELAELEAAKDQHGSYKAAIMAGLRALDASESSAVSEAVAIELEKMAKKIRASLK